MRDTAPLAMIMWRLCIILTALVTCVVLSASCDMPEVDDIDLSGCMRGCNEDAKSCLDASDATIATCDPDDNLCLLGAFRAAETCLTTCLDCISVCVEETEEILKE